MNEKLLKDLVRVKINFEGNCRFRITRLPEKRIEL
jgi:hypothetical protein